MIGSFLPQFRAVCIWFGNTVQREGGYADGKLKGEEAVHQFRWDPPFLRDI